MDVKIRVTEGVLDPEDKRVLFEWGQNIFGVEDARLQWRPKDIHFIVEVDGRPASHVGVLKHTVSAGGAPVVVCGVGGVVTVPEMQGKGLAQRGMRHAAAFMCEEFGVEFGLLFCLDHLKGFYESLGWRPAPERTEVEQAGGPITMPYNTMVLPCGGGAKEWPAGEIKLNSPPW